MKVKFYASGGMLFTVFGREWDDRIERLLNELGIDVYLPWRDSKAEYYRKTLPLTESRRKIFEADRDGVDACQGFNFLCEGPDSIVSSGTCWEAGYAFERKKLLVGFRTDYRGDVSPILRQCMYKKKVCRTMEEFRNLARIARREIIEKEIMPTRYDPPKGRKHKLRRAYIACPYYSGYERRFAMQVKNTFQKRGFDAFLWWQEAGLAGKFGEIEQQSWGDIFRLKICLLEDSDFVIAILEGGDCDCEASWDSGYAYSQYKPVFGYRTDYRTLGDLAGTVNLMLEQSIVDSRLCRGLSELVDIVESKKQ